MTVMHLAPCAVDNYWYIDQVHKWWERHFKTLRKLRFYVISNCKPSLILQIFTQLSLLSAHISLQRRGSFSSEMQC